MASVLITGATGFIGSHLAAVLARRGDEVRCLARQVIAPDRVELLKNLGAQIVRGDVCDPSSLGAAMADVDVVYHLAGRTKVLRAKEFQQVNEQGVDNVAQACAAASNPPRLVVLSSLAAAGPSERDKPRTEDEPTVPVSKYGRSKRAGELAAARWADQVPTSIVRPPIVFGERDPGLFVMFRMIARRGLHTVPGLRPSQFSVIHADDLAQAMILVAEQGDRLPAKSDATGQGVYFVATDDMLTYAELGHMIGIAVGRLRLRVLPIPMPLMWAACATSQSVGWATGRPTIVNIDKCREAAAGHWTCSNERIRTLGFESAMSLAERLRQTADWYRDEGWL